MTTIARTKLTLTAMATAAVAIALPATANAGIPPSFQTPSGNIMCWVGQKMVSCRIADYTYSAQGQDCGSPGWPNGFLLKQGMPAKLVSGRSYQRLWRKQLAEHLGPNDLIWPPPSRYER